MTRARTSTSSSSAPVPEESRSPSVWLERGWRVVILEPGPFWDPDRDWVSDEAGSHHIYWTAPG